MTTEYTARLGILPTLPWPTPSAGAHPALRAWHGPWTCIALALVALATSALAEQPAVAPAVVELGDPRKTVVTIEDDGTTYRLAVTMLAVKSFDSGSDREANRSLSRSSAVAALAKHLQVGTNGDLAVSGLAAGGESLEGGRFALAFTVPKAGVKIVGKPSSVAKVRLDPEFADYRLADPLLMEVEGAKVIRLEDDRILVLGVASSALESGTAADRKRAETTQAKVKGATRDFPIVGRWTSDDGTLFSVAVGGFFKQPD